MSLARFSDAQYQSIDKYMNSSEFENKQALLEKAKEEVDLMRERKVISNRLIPTFAFLMCAEENPTVAGQNRLLTDEMTSQVHDKGAKRGGAG